MVQLVHGFPSASNLNCVASPQRHSCTHVDLNTLSFSGFMKINFDHRRSYRQILDEVLQIQKCGDLGFENDPRLREVLLGSVYRYSRVAWIVQGRHKILDVGSGTGLLAGILSRRGHDCHGIDIMHQTESVPMPYIKNRIKYSNCNVEIDRFPFPDGTFDAVVCGQTLEHFTHSHLPAMLEIFRVLKEGGLIEVDVPNVASFRNRLRLLRGKNITWDYRDHYIHSKPTLYSGRSFFPVRHNREFTKHELKLLLSEAGFESVVVHFYSDPNQRLGFSRYKSAGSFLRNLIPSWRKSLIGTGIKPGTSQGAD